jgi:FkbM family methyltransferase
MLEFKTYSQYGEDKILKDILGETGYFLEIGSFHPTIFSNTRFLVEKNWSGCYVDGSPSAIQRFIEEYKTNPNIKIVQCLIGQQNGLITFYDSINDGISTTDINHMLKWKNSGSPFREIITSIITFDTLSSVLPSTIDFINIDVEGQSAELAKLINYNKYNTKVVCVEHDGKTNDLNLHFSTIGFTSYFTNHTNSIFIKS